MRGRLYRVPQHTVSASTTPQPDVACARRAQVLEHANVEFFVVLRSSSPLLVALADWRFLGRELPDARNTGILLFILLGALGFVQQDPTVSAGAAAWGATWLCVFTFDQCFIKHGVPPRLP